MNVLRIGPVVLASLLLAWGATAHAQDASLGVNVVSVTDGDYPNVVATLNIEDTGAAAGELSADAFAVTVNGSPTTVLSAELANSEDEPLDVLITIDTSGSMLGAPIASAKEAAKAFINDLAVNDRVAVLSFGDDVVLLQDYTADRALSLGAVDSLAAFGNTALYQAVTVSAIKAASSTASRRAVILLSDGADFGGRSIATREESIGAAMNAGVPIYTIAQGNTPLAIRAAEPLDRVYLTEVANVSRGRYLEAPNPEDLQSLYANVGRLLRSQYLVTFDASGAGAEAQLAVTVVSGDRSATGTASYRPGSGFAPAIVIAGLDAGDDITEPRDIAVMLNTPATATVTWFVDDVHVFDASAPPYVYRYDPAGFGAGEHALRVTVVVGAGRTEASVSFSSQPVAAGGGSGLPLAPIAAAVAVSFLVVGGIVLFVLKRLRASEGSASIDSAQRITPWSAQIAQRRTDALPPSDDDEIAPVAEAIGEPLGKLIARAGPDLGSEYKIGGRPVSIGSGRSCGVFVDDPELSIEEARIWVRDGHLMLHRMTRLSIVADDGVTGGWSILEPGDAFEVGQHAFEFRLLQEPAASQASADIPNILRDPSTPRAGVIWPRTDPPAPASSPSISDLMSGSDESAAEAGEPVADAGAPSPDADELSA